jgi:imidazolonepropionase-like amidohydrolase
MFRPMLAAAAVLAAVSAYAAEPQPAFAPLATGKRVVYRHVGLIDGIGSGLRPDMAVVTNGPLIEAVLPDSQLGARGRGAEIVDLKGRFLLPGLIDSHQHLATPPNRRQAEALMRRQLYGGITAIRDMADDLRSIGELTRASLVGDIAGPDIYYAALMAGPSFFADPRTRAAAEGAEPGRVPWMQAITDETDLPLAVAMARGTYATAIKIYANLPPRLVSRITREAHRQNIRVWAHGMVFPATPAEVVEAGPDVISHTCYLAYQASEKRPRSYQERFPVDYSKFRDGDNPVMAGLFREMRRRNIILDATVRVYVEGEKAAAKRPGKPPLCTADLAERLTNQAWREGVAISAGTDGETPAADPYPSLHEELILLAEKTGMPPAQVIRSATLIGAMTIGRERSMGSVEPGKLANLLVVAKNPLESLRNLRTVLMIVKRGRRYSRADFRPIDKSEMPED